MAYCGCGSKTNKMRWAAVVLLLALAVIFLIVNIIVGRDCKVCKTETNDNGVETRTCSGDPDFGDNDWDDIEGCSEGAVTATFFLFIICAVASLVPCCCMCCCAKPPQKQHEYAVAVTSKPEQHQPATYASQQTYGQPVQAQPAYAVTGYGHAQPQGQVEVQPPRVHDVNSPAVV